jgi:hypothetical protein
MTETVFYYEFSSQYSYFSAQRGLSGTPPGSVVLDAIDNPEGVPAGMLTSAARRGGRSGSEHRPIRFGRQHR